MDKQTVFKKVMVADRLPEFSNYNYCGYFFTDLGVISFDKFDGWENKISPTWWLEKVELPSEEEVNKFKPLDNSIVGIYDSGYYNGVNYILNKLK